MAKLYFTNEYLDLMEEIYTLMATFDAEVTGPSKASLKRARKVSLELSKKFKEFRKISNKLDLLKNK